MKIIILLSTSTLLLISCDHHVSARLSRFDSIAFADTTCKAEIRAAKADLLKGRITYCHFIGMLSDPFRNEDEMIELLRENKIRYKTELISDVITDQTQGCYCDFMTEEIKARFGDHFIDSLLDVSDSIYLVRHIHDTINYSSCDLWARYPGDIDSSHTEQCLPFQARCDSLIKYPMGYKYGASAFANVYFVINKIGQARISGFNFLFDIQNNHRFEEYFGRQIEKIVQKDGWAPAVIRKQKVNSMLVLRVFFE